MASLSISQIQQVRMESFPQKCHSQFAVTRNVSFSACRLPNSQLGVAKISTQIQPNLMDAAPISQVPLLSCEEAMKRQALKREKERGEQEFLAMYSSVFGGITADPAAMLIPIDDHMVHRGHAVFDTAAIVDGYLYGLDQHLDRFLKSASMAKIKLPFDRKTMKSILIDTVNASKCKNGIIRYWLSVGLGDFKLSPSGCPHSTLYAIVYRDTSPPPNRREGVKVVTSKSVPIKPPLFATTKNVNYLPNALCLMEAEEQGCFASIWLDSEGFVAEGPSMNVAFVTKEKELVMPRFDRILSGCNAKRVIELADELVMDGLISGVSVRDVTMEEGKQAEEMMLLGSCVLVRPVIQWDDQVIGNGKGGRVAEALLQLLLKDMKSGPSTFRIPVPY